MGTPPTMSVVTFASIVNAVDAENPDRPEIGTMVILVEGGSPPTIMSNFPNIDEVLIWLIQRSGQARVEEHPIPERKG